MEKQTTLGSEVQFQKGYAFKSSWYRPEGHPVVRVSDFTDSSVDTSDLVFIPEEIAKDYGKYGLHEGDVVIQTVGSWPSNPASVVGKVIRIQRGASGALLNQNAVKLIPSASFDQRYLFYRLKNEDYRSYIINTAQGAASCQQLLVSSASHPFFPPTMT
jgi:type I restriction enzyme S subunit